MSVESTTATCDQHIVEANVLVGIMDDSSITSGYNGYTMGSMLCSIFNNNPVGSKNGSVTTSDINIEDIDTNINVDPIDTSIIHEDALLDDLSQ